MSAAGGDEDVDMGSGIAAPPPAPAKPAVKDSDYIPIKTDFPGVRKLYSSPPMYAVDDFLSEEECKLLIQEGGPKLFRSVVVGGKDGTDEPRVQASSRTSRSYFFPKPETKWLNERVGQLVMKPTEHLEPAQIAHYTAGQLYAAHFDAFDVTTGPGRECIATGGQRVATVLIYLNDVESGGCTYFPVLDRRFKPKRGQALVFFPCTADGQLDDLALHTAEAAVDDKWVSQVWVRQANFQ